MSSNRYPPELRGRAVRLVAEQCSEYSSEPDAIRAIAPKIGCHTDTFRSGGDEADRAGGDPLYSASYSRYFSCPVFNPEFWLGIHFLLLNGYASLVILGAVFLCVTGAEALYADMGHFGTG